MQITEIKAASSTNIHTGETWLKVDCLCLPSPGETPDEAFEKLASKVDELEAKWKQKRLAGQPLLPVIKEDSKQGDDIIVGYINACTSVDDKVNGLITFEAMCRGNKVLTQAYNKKLSQLQKPTNGKPAKLP
jgi:hypothetical protein